MTNHLVPDSALDWCARGFTATQIVRILHERTGRKFTIKGIENTILWARREGDMRAARRNGPPAERA